MWIAQSTIDGSLVVPAASVGTDVTPETAATAMGWPDGSWRVITDDEAAALRKPTLEEALTAKLAEIMSGYSAAFAPVEAVYPAAEREGWPVQEAEARALMADPQAETPVLSALVVLRARGETVADLAQKVLTNAAQWRMVYAYLTGQQQHMYAEVTALAAEPGVTGEDVIAYPVEYRMPDGL